MQPEKMTTNQLTEYIRKCLGTDKKSLTEKQKNRIEYLFKLRDERSDYELVRSRLDEKNIPEKIKDYTVFDLETQECGCCVVDYYARLAEGILVDGRTFYITSNDVVVEHKKRNITW